jgi:hypothetical protein
MLAPLARRTRRIAGSIAVAGWPYEHGHAAIAPPARRLELNVGCGNLVSQQRGQQHPIIGQPRFLADHRDGVTAAGAIDKLLAKAGRRHAIADDDQGFTHANVFSDFDLFELTASLRRSSRVVAGRFFSF